MARKTRGQKIRDFRKFLNESRKVFGTRWKLSYHTVVGYENNNNPPGKRVCKGMAQLAKEMNYPLSLESLIDE